MEPPRTPPKRDRLNPRRTVWGLRPTPALIDFVEKRRGDRGPVLLYMLDLMMRIEVGVGLEAWAEIERRAKVEGRDLADKLAQLVALGLKADRKK